jgi:hypothetical protein
MDQVQMLPATKISRVDGADGDDRSEHGSRVPRLPIDLGQEQRMLKKFWTRRNEELPELSAMFSGKSKQIKSSEIEKELE